MSKLSRADALTLVTQAIDKNRVPDLPHTGIDDAALEVIREAHTMCERAAKRDINKVGSGLRRFWYHEPAIKELDAVARKTEAATRVTKASTDHLDAVIEHRQMSAHYHAQSLALGGEVRRINSEYEKRQVIASLENAEEIAAAQTRLVANRHRRDCLALGYEPSMVAHGLREEAEKSEAATDAIESEKARRFAMEQIYTATPPPAPTDPLQVLRQEEADALLTGDTERIDRAQRAIAAFTRPTPVKTQAGE